MMLGTMRLVVLRAFPLVKGYGANLAVKCDGVLAFVVTASASNLTGESR